MTKSNSEFLKALVWVNGAVPGALLIWDAYHGQLGANPVNFAIRTTGLLCLIFLIGSLAVTPLRQLTGLEWLYPHRRTLGLYAAFYAFAHFSIFFWWDREASIASTWNEIKTRQYIWYGMTALVIFIPLTITSTQGMMRLMGPAAWKWLHRLVYIAAIGGSIHYLLVNKVVAEQAKVFAGIFAAFLLYRYVRHYFEIRRAVTAPAAFPVMPAKKKFWTGQLKVVKTFDETPDVRTFRLAPVDGSMLPFDYKPGQYMNLALSIDGQRVNRSYTIASSPTRAGHLELTVKREEMGVSSGHLHKSVKVGDVINVSAPAGKFTFDGKTADSVVLIAGGVGITPLMSKIRYLTDLAWPGEIYLIFSVRNPASIIFREELELLTKRFSNLHVTITVTQPDASWRGETGRISVELLNRVVPHLKTRPIHICGPTAMADATKEMLVHAGVPEAQIEMESFTSPKKVLAMAGGEGSVVETQPGDAMTMAGGGVHTVTFRKSNKTVEVPADQVLLEAAEDAGVSINFDCRSGICGQCKTRLITGDVTMAAEDALTPSDRAQGIILACQARCTEDVTVDA